LIKAIDRERRFRSRPGPTLSPRQEKARLLRYHLLFLLPEERASMERILSRLADFGLEVEESNLRRVMKGLGLRLPTGSPKAHWRRRQTVGTAPCTTPTFSVWVGGKKKRVDPRFYRETLDALSKHVEQLQPADWLQKVFRRPNYR